MEISCESIIFNFRRSSIFFELSQRQIMSALQRIDAMITFLDKANDIIVDTDYDKTGIIIEEFQQNCILIHNALTLDEQMELYQSIEGAKRNFELTKFEQKENMMSTVLIYEANQDYDGLFMKNFHNTCYYKMANKTRGIIDRNYKFKNLKKDISKYRVDNITALKYPSINGQLGIHCDRNPSVVFLYSIGCTANFYVFGDKMRKNEDKEFVDKRKDGQVFKFKSGDMLFFDASNEANIQHGVISIDDSDSCPAYLKEKCKGIENFRISCQIRAW